MKVCYVCADPGVTLVKQNGSAAHLSGIIHALTDLGHDITLAMANPHDATELPARIVPLGPVGLYKELTRLENSGQCSESLIDSDRHRLIGELGRIWRNENVSRAVFKLVSTGGFDVVYERATVFIAGGALACRAFGTPHVLEFNAPLTWEATRFGGLQLTEAANLLEQALFSASDHICCNAKELKDELLLAGVSGEKVSIIPCGTDAARFLPEGPQARAHRPDEIVIGFVGSLKPWHGIDHMAQMFRTLAQDPRYHLLVIGTGPQASTVEALERELPGRVSYPGSIPRDQVPAWLRSMDIALAPYPALEKFYFSPVKLMEYMASGRAIVASRVGQITELLDHGRLGELVPPGDGPAMAAAIAALADNPERRKSLGAAAAAEARAKHQWSARAAEITTIFDKLTTAATQRRRTQKLSDRSR